MAHYFRRIPEFVYRSQLNTRSSNTDNLNVKNFFRRFKLREDIQNNFVAFEKYRIRGEERPDQVADYFYGDPTLDWIVLSVNNIINQNNSWPLNQDSLYNYALEKYGSENKLTEIKHYETYEVIDPINQFDQLINLVILNGGQIVDSNFTFTYFNDHTKQYLFFDNDYSARPISNFEYEIKLNDIKREIIILRKEFLDQAVIDSIRELRYKNSSEYISNTLKNSNNSRITNPN
jgi:hypothetical protein